MPHFELRERRSSRLLPVALILLILSMAAASSSCVSSVKAKGSGVSRLAIDQEGSTGPLTVIPQALDTWGSYAVDYSPDGSLAAAAAINGDVRIWRLSDRLLIGLYKGFNYISQISFSPDGRYLAIGRGAMVQVMDARSGQMVFEKEDHKIGKTWFMSFGADDDTLLAIALDKTDYQFSEKAYAANGPDTAVVLRRYYPMTKRETETRSIYPMIPSCFFVSRKNRTAGFGTSSGKVIAFDQSRLTMKEAASTDSWIYGLGMGTDGRWRFISDGKLRTVDEKGRILDIAPLDVNESARYSTPASFPESGTTGMFYRKDKKAASFDIMSGQITEESLCFFDSLIGALALHPGGGEFMASAYTHPAGHPFHFLSGPAPASLDCCYIEYDGMQNGPEGDFVFSGAIDEGSKGQGRVFSLNLKELGSGIRTLSCDPVKAIQLVDEGSRIALSTRSGFYLGDAAAFWTSPFEKSANLSGALYFRIEISPDGRYAYYARKGQGKTELVRGAIGPGSVGETKVLCSIGELKQGDSFNLSLSRDGGLLLFQGGDGKNVLLYDMRKEAIVFERRDWESVHNVLSPDGSLLVLSRFQEVDNLVFDTRTGRQVASFGPPKSSMEYSGKRAFSGDMRYFAVCTHSKLFVYETKPWRLKRSFIVNAGARDLGCLFFSEDGRYVVRSDANGVVNFCNMENGEIVRFMKTDSDWIFFTDDGYFEGSRDAGRMLALTRGDEAYGVDQLAVRFNRPDIIMERLGVVEANPELYAWCKAKYRYRLQRMGLDEATVSGPLRLPVARIDEAIAEGNMALVRASFEGRGRELKRYTAYVNDVPLYGAEGLPLSGQEARAEIPVVLTPGENKIEVSCFDDAGAESFRVLTKVTGPGGAGKESGNLYYLGFGVSRYRDGTLNLNYAHKDALDLARVFQTLEGTSFGKVYARAYTDEQVNQETVSLAKDFLASSRPQDTVVLFIAGHGVFTQGGAAPDYYYLDYDTELRDLERTAIRFAEIEELLQGIPCRQKLFLLDTCDSGEVDPTEAAGDAGELGARGIRPRGIRGLSVVAAGGQAAAGQSATAFPVRRPWLSERDRYIQNDLIRRSGAVVFSSSRGGEYSYETEETENGLFTHAMLVALEKESGADANGDGQVDLREMVAFVSSYVPELSSNRQHPGVDKDNLAVRFGLPTYSKLDTDRRLVVEFSDMPGMAGMEASLLYGPSRESADARPPERMTLRFDDRGDARAEVTWKARQGLCVDLVGPDGSRPWSGKTRGNAPDGSFELYAPSVRDLGRESDRAAISGSSPIAAITLNDVAVWRVRLLRVRFNNMPGTAGKQLVVRSPAIASRWNPEAALRAVFDQSGSASFELVLDPRLFAGELTLDLTEEDGSTRPWYPATIGNSGGSGVEAGEGRTFALPALAIRDLDPDAAMDWLIDGSTAMAALSLNGRPILSTR